MSAVAGRTAGITGARRHAASPLCFAFAGIIAAIFPDASYAETTAGVTITNIAQLSASTPDGGLTVASNPATLIVGERLDVVLARTNGAVVAVTPGVAAAVALTNAGNGSEAFDLVATPSDATVRVRGIAVDTDRDGRFDPAIDTLLADGRTPVLAPGATQSLLVVIDPATNPVTATRLSLTASAVTGSGAPGTTFASRGDGGGDAVTGATGASARLEVPLGGAAAAPTLVKSQRVAAPDGSPSAVRDAIVTYSLEARFPGPASNARIADPVPAGTLYVPGSLTLDGATLSDAADADAGEGDAGGIAVRLGDIAAPATRTVTFQVKIQ